MPTDPKLNLVVYGDFNCPFSALASARAARLERHGVASVDWRAVEHAPDIATAGEAVSGHTRHALQDELDQIRGLLRDGEADRFVVPPVLSNTHRAIAAYAAAPAADRLALRERIFDAFWVRGENVSDPKTLRRLVDSTAEDEATAARWHEEWTAMPRPLVPVMVLPDGHVSRGLGALSRLAEFKADNR